MYSDVSCNCHGVARYRKDNVGLKSESGECNLKEEARDGSGDRSQHLLIIYPRDVVSAVNVTATWLGGWLSVGLSQPVLCLND